MKKREPIYVTRKDTFLATDPIEPYGGRIGRFSSETKRKEAAIRLMKVSKPGFR